MVSERSQPEWLDMKALRGYACVSERTIRDWIRRPVNSLPAVQVGSKILVRRSTFDQWLESHHVKVVDVSGIVNELVAGMAGAD
jgi:excisionase family DNA binding protein